MLTRIILLVLLVSAFVTGCSPTLLENYTLGEPATDFGLGFSIDYPSDWRAVEYPFTAKTKAILRDAHTLALLTRTPTPYFNGIVTLQSPNDEARVQVTVIGSDTPLTIEELETSYLENDLLNTEILEQRRMELSNHRAIYRHTKYFDKTPDVQKWKENIFVQVIAYDNKLWVIEYRAPSGDKDLFEKHKQEGLAIINSFRILE